MAWKLDGLSEYDVRRPMTMTATNLLGVVKHTASVEAGYFGETFGRPFPQPLPWFAPGAEVNADMWATPEESREQILDLYRQAWAHSDETISSLGLDAEGEVPWWPPERRRVTLHQILVHMTTETDRHLGQMDIVRELIDGAVGVRADNASLPDEDASWWSAYRDKVQAAADTFRTV
jgi:uncharacterized damage-inducible protein DinB